jgi:hypothetical protein
LIEKTIFDFEEDRSRNPIRFNGMAVDKKKKLKLKLIFFKKKKTNQEGEGEERRG